MSTRTYILTVTLTLIVGAAMGRYLTPEKVVTKTVTQIQKVDVVHTNVVTITKTIKQPNGTIETDTTTVDKSVDQTNTNTTSETSKTVTRDNPQWHVSGDFSSSSSLPYYIYGAKIERRILGPIFLGAFGNANRQFGASIGLEF
jgi:hypothetical protein